jgi:hypothetical protein
LRASGTSSDCTAAALTAASPNGSPGCRFLWRCSNTGVGRHHYFVIEKQQYSKQFNFK